MTKAGLSRLWFRVGPLAVVGAVAVAVTAQGCSDETGTTSASTTTTTSSQSASSGAGGSGGEGVGSSTSSTGGSGGGMAAPFEGKVAQVANGPEFQNPYDAAPNPKGDLIYFTAVDANSMPGVFRVKADGSAKVESFAVGAPFVSPLGIAVGVSGDMIYVADPGWDTGKPTPGAIVSIPNDGGTPTAVAGTEGYVPQSLDVIDENGTEVAYFTGIGPSGGPGAFKINVKGGAAEEVFQADKADPALALDTLSGITAAKDGSSVYFINVNSSGSAQVLEAKSGVAAVFTSNLYVGNPAGIAISLDQKELFVSAREQPGNTSAVFRYPLDTKEGLPLNETIKAYTEPAGLHRAHDANVYAFVDNTAQGTGTIFVLR